MKPINESAEDMYGNANFNRNPWDNRYGHSGTPPISGTPSPSYRSTIVGPMNVDHCANMHGWQQQLVGMLGGNRDVYILSQPGSGKTLPVICYWVNTILGISTGIQPNSSSLMKLLTEPQNIPQVLWLVPIKNLSANIAQEMIERFTEIILQILNRTGSSDQNGNYIFDNTNLDIRTIINSMSNFGSGQSRSLLLGLIQHNNQVEANKVDEFKTNLGVLVKNYVENALVGRKEEMVNTIKIRHNSMDSYKPFIISIYESAGGIIGNINRLKLIVFDEAQRIQGGSESDERRAAQIGDNVHKMLFHNNGRNARIVMLSGSVSRNSAANVMHFFNMAYKRNFAAGPYQTPDTVTNPSPIRVNPIAHLDDKFTQLRIISNALAGGKKGIVFIVFGKKRINELIDQIATSEVGISNPGRNLQTTRGSLYNRRDVSSITNPGNINDLDDERLRRAASNGLGYLYRPEEENMTTQRQRDTVIVQRLFKDGVIRVLIVTDAVREGINITCNEMYIPTIIKPPDNKEMDPGSLTQLINRAGRKEGRYAIIYTDPKFVGKISVALSNNPNTLGEQPFSLPGSTATKTEVMLNYGTNITADVAVSIGRGIMKVFS